MVLAAGLAGCAGKKIEKTAPELAEEGRHFFEQGNYAKAMESYKRLKDWYPYSPLAREALLRVADSHYHLKEYEEAIFGYQQYEQLYPNDPEIPYVIYQIGLSHYERLRSIDRTQVPARNALTAFERLRSQFPASEYAEKAAPMIEKCIENMAGHEFQIGHFYFRSGHYLAAVNRFEKVLRDYPVDLEIREKASEYLAMAEKRLAGPEDPREQPETGRQLEKRLPQPEGPLTRPSPEPVPGPSPTP